VNFASALRNDIALFSESQSRVLLSASPEKADSLKAWLEQQGVPYQVLGTVKGRELQIQVNGTEVIRSSVDRLEEVWKEAIPCLMK
jgi:phosphoribosylformylglycinamidine synthase